MHVIFADKIQKWCDTVMARSISTIAVFYNSAQHQSRQFVHGVLRYANTFNHFRIEILDILAATGIPKDCRGIIVGWSSIPFREKILANNLPTVFSKINTRQFGVIAAEFFLTRTPRTFAYIGMGEASWWDRGRGEAFAERIQQSGHRAHLYFPSGESLTPGQESVRLQKWLKNLTKPLALFAANDARARDVLTACEHAGITVPYEATILGVDNDEWLCESAHPRLSSITFRAEESGYEAAKRLYDLIHSRRSKKGPRLCETPVLLGEVIERESTTDRTVADSTVGRALAFIASYKGLELRTTDVAKKVGLSLNHLERLFRRTLGFSIKTEIQRVRLETILHLVRETNTPPGEIAHLCGFTNVTCLCRIIKEATGQTMSELRNQATSC